MKYLWGLLATFIVTSANAQSLEFEVFRTQESPGFFAVRIFNDVSNHPLEIQDTFIINTDKKEYESVIEVLKEIGAEVIEAQDLSKVAPENRVILLGGSNQNLDYLHFQLESPEEPLDQFQEWSDLFLTPAYLRDITATFGGNISEVRPAKLNFLTEQPNAWVGKFKKPQRTLMNFEATGTEGVLEAQTILDLESYQAHPLEHEIQGIWESLDPQAQSKSNWNPKAVLLNFFPILLILLGIILLIVFLRIQLKSMRDKKAQEEHFWAQDLEQTSEYKQWEENIPFEVKQK